MIDHSNAPSPRTHPLPRRHGRAAPSLVHYIRERYYIDGATIEDITKALKGRLSASYVHRIAIGERRRNVPYSQRILDWIDQTGRTAGLD